MNINLSKEDSIKKLDLRKQTLKISLEKKQMFNTQARVAVVMDKSGSMRNLYKNHVVQDVLERFFPLALKFDDNEELDVWLFNTDFVRMPSITYDNFHNYVDNVVMTGLTEKYWGQTKYAPVMEDIFNKYVIEDPSDIPTYVIFVTDGNNSDKKNTKDILKKASDHNIFWQYVGIGDEKFEFLQRLDDLKGRTIDNANFFEIKDIENIPDNQLYDLLLNEYPEWEKEAKRIGILKQETATI